MRCRLREIRAAFNNSSIPPGGIADSILMAFGEAPQRRKVPSVYSPRRLGKLTIPVIIAAATITTSTAIAAADATDDAFIAKMHSLGVTWPQGEDSIAVAMGHAICADRNAGNTPDQVASEVHKSLNGKGFTYQDATAIVSAAESTYCPG
jgi:hypothetical protein